MASLYDSASLVMIPSGVKEDKLYSIKPTDGSGDFTFSRGSDIEATRVNSSGLIEKAKVNLLSYSNTFNNYSVWGLNESDATSGETGYDGSTDAWRLTANGISPYINQGNFSGLRTISIYVKAGTYDQVSFLVGGYTQGVQFDLTSGTIITNSNASIFYPVITSISGGWYRISLFIAPNAPTYSFLVSPQLLNGGGIAIGEYIYIQDAQVNHGLIAQDYVETTTTAVVEGLTADLPRLDYSGGASCPSLLLEPSRTNLVTQSEYLGSSDWGKNSIGTGVAPSLTFGVTSPEGVDNAYEVTFNSGAGTSSSDQSVLNFGIGGQAAGDYTLSFYAKVSSGTDKIIARQAGGFLYTTINLTDEWQRFETTETLASAGTISIDLGLRRGLVNEPLNSSVTCQIYGIQVEAGSYRTSYIPTYGTAANRGEEYIYNTTTNFKTEGILGSTWTFMYDQTFVDVARDAASSVFLIDNGNAGGDGLTNVRISLNSNGSFRLQDSDGTQLSTDGNKILCRYDGSTIAWFIDGTLLGSHSVTDANFANLNRYNPSQNNKKKIVLNQVLIFPTALTDAEAIALTTI